MPYGYKLIDFLKFSWIHSSSVGDSLTVLLLLCNAYGLADSFIVWLKLNKLSKCCIDRKQGNFPFCLLLTWRAGPPTTVCWCLTGRRRGTLASQCRYRWWISSPSEYTRTTFLNNTGPIIIVRYSSMIEILLLAVFVLVTSAHGLDIHNVNN